MLFVGVDPGLNLGLAAIRHDEHVSVVVDAAIVLVDLCVYRDYGTIDGKERLSAARMKVAQDSIRGFAERLVRDADDVLVMAYEMPGHMRSRDALFATLACAFMAERVAAAMRNTRPIRIAPAQAKNAVGCMGNATKDEVGRAVQNLGYTHGTDYDDEDDAIAIALAGACVVGARPWPDVPRTPKKARKAKSV